MDWFHAHESLSWTLFAVSLVLSVGGILAAPVIVVYLPEDYFLEGTPRPGAWRTQHPAIRWTLHALKNALGAALVLTGIVLALPLIPGPGVLTLLVGLSLVDFPGKRRLERKIIGYPRVLKQVNALRAKAGHPPLRV